MGRWNQPLTVQDVVDTTTTMVVHNGLFTNFIGCLVASAPPIQMLTLIHHFLNSLATGPHHSLDEFKVDQIVLCTAHDEYQVIVHVKHAGQELWHTHVVTSHGIPRTTGPGTIMIGPSEGDTDE